MKSSLKIVAAIIFVAALSAWLAPVVSAQQHSHGQDNKTSTAGGGKRKAVAPSYAWQLIAPLGLREPSTIDTLMLDYYRNSIPSEVSDAWATTGNLGAEGMNMIFNERPAMSDFFFRDALEHWLPSERKTRYYNTRIPMTLLSFNSSGGKETAQERLQATFSGNINAKAQVGAMLDYLYSKGSYANQATKNLTWGAFGSYIGDRYEMQAYYHNFNLLNKENGGITDMLYITDPAELQGGVTTIDPKSIPTRLNDAHTRLRGDELYVNNRYKVGYWHEEQVDDTTVNRTYIPVSSFIHTLKYTGMKHMFLDGSPKESKEFFEHTYLDPRGTRDRTTYMSVSNTLGVSLLEGFHRYAKFGLAAYVTYEYRKYKQTADTLDRTLPELGLDPFPEGADIADKASEHLAYVGAQLTKQRGSLLTYAATAQLGFAGAAAGDVMAEGRVATKFKFLRDSMRIEAFGSFRNEHAPYLMKNYRSNHFVWQNDFGKRRTFDFGGTLKIGRTRTELTVGLSNLQNHIYFDSSFLPRQHGGSVPVFYARLQQNFKVGILHWDNSVTYQKTSNDLIIPLPELAVYSNLYLLARIATLRLQFGVDCDYYTSYYAPSYQPATATFANVREMKIGNYPFLNVYANMKLSKARFYVMFSHVNQGLFGSSGYFSMPYYPLNPRRLQIGVSVDFTN